MLIRCLSADKCHLLCVRVLWSWRNVALCNDTALICCFAEKREWSEGKNLAV